MYASCLHVSLSSSRLIAANECVWLTEGNEFHLVEALAQLVESFTVSQQMVSPVDRCVELHSLFNLYLSMIIVLNLLSLQVSMWDCNLIGIQSFSCNRACYVTLIGSSMGDFMSCL
jgi:hypothetical protein